MEIYTVTEPFLHLNCGLAESPFCEKDENVLRFVDIVNSAVYRVNLNEGPNSLTKQSYESAICVTGELAAAPDSFIFGGKYGIGIGKKASNETKLLHKFWSEAEEHAGKPAKMRANDGAVDCQGRFWVSALCDPEVGPVAAHGVLFRLDTDGTLDRVVSDMTIPNGMSWSTDNKTLYLTDTHHRSIYAYDFDQNSGNVTEQRVFFQTPEGTGPDGHAQDEYGNLWVAIWGAWKVVRVSPEGKVTAEIRLPTRCITAVAFAGDDMYITSERDPEPDLYPDSVPFQGDIFKCRVGVRRGPVYAASIKGISRQPVDMNTTGGLP